MIKEPKKRRHAFWTLSLLNPKNLAREVHVYGYDFSWKSHILLIICSLIAISAVGLLFELKPLYFTVVMAAVIIALPLLILISYKRMYEQKRFSDAITYMEQMLYAFQKSGKIGTALTETRELFDTGMMRSLIDQAIEYLQRGCAKTEKGVMREALEIVENHYQCSKLHTLHELLIGGEEYGGEVQDSIQLVLANLELWKRRSYKLQAKKKASHTDNVISIAVATVFCAATLYVLRGMSDIFPGVSMNVSIFQVEIIQFSSMVFLLFMLYILLISQNTLAEDWLQADSLHKSEFVQDSYEAVLKYDEAKEKKKSILWALPLFGAAVVEFAFYSKWIGIAFLLAGAFMLSQHKIGYNLAKKDVNEELYFALPQWFMELALLLQNNNVQVALIKSVPGAPPMLTEELNQLIERLQIAPERLESYTDFCKAFDVPEAGSCMKMLHAISESGTGDISIQLANLVQRVNEMQDMADDMRNEDIAFKSKIIFSYPIFGCTVKLLIDLSVGMVFMFNMLGNMGGI